MRKVFKYPVFVNQDTRLSLPAAGKVVLVASQNLLTIWVDLEEDDEKVIRTFYVVGTGAPVPDHAHHVGSCFDGMFVWHVYEIKEPT